ncbi:MAG: hypothetical protein ACKOGA_13975 [Planctomycetaceae bacterium]
MFVRGILGAAVGAVAGAAVWSALVYFLNVEVGFVAWGIGFLTGLLALWFSGSDGSPALGVASALLALLGVAAGKVFAIWLLLGNVVVPPVNPEQLAISYLADGIVEERQSRGERVVFPPGKSLETALSQLDYPPEIWAAAEKEWQTTSAEDRQVFLAAKVSAQGPSATDRLKFALERVFSGKRTSPFDLLWVFLAVSTAYKLGNGSSDS